MIVYSVVVVVVFVEGGETGVVSGSPWDCVVEDEVVGRRRRWHTPRCESTLQFTRA